MPIDTKTEKNETLQFAVTKLVLGILCLVLGWVSLRSLQYKITMDSEETVTILPDSPLKLLLVLALAVAVGVALRHNNWNFSRWNKAFPATLALVATGYVVYLWVGRLHPTADQQTCIEIAISMSEGNYAAWLPGNYMHKCPNQNGWVLMLYLLKSVLGDLETPFDTMALTVQMLNVVFALVAAFYIARITGLVLNLKRTKHIVLLLLLYAPLMFYVTFAYGTMASFAFGMAGVYYGQRFLQQGSPWFCALSAVLLALGYICKSNALIFIVAMVLLVLFHALVQKRKDCLVAALSFLAVCFAANSLVNTTVENITGTTLGEGAPPTIAFVTMGLQESSRGNGWFNGYHYVIYQNSGYNTEIAKQQAVQDLKDQLQYMRENPDYTKAFFRDKNISMWCDGSFQSIWIQLKEVQQQAIYEKPVSPTIETFVNQETATSTLYFAVYEVVQTAVYVFALCYLVANWQTLSMDSLTLGIVFLGGFFFHTFWEAKGQYTITYFVLLIPYATLGYRQLVAWVCAVLFRQQPTKKAQPAQKSQPTPHQYAQSQPVQSYPPVSRANGHKIQRADAQKGAKDTQRKIKRNDKRR